MHTCYQWWLHMLYIQWRNKNGGHDDKIRTRSTRRSCAIGEQWWDRWWNDGSCRWVVVPRWWCRDESNNAGWWQACDMSLTQRSLVSWDEVIVSATVLQWIFPQQSTPSCFDPIKTPHSCEMGSKVWLVPCSLWQCTIIHDVLLLPAVDAQSGKIA